MATHPNDSWHGIPRTEIVWHPTVVDERCVGCGLCVISCGRGVYAYDYGRAKAAVAKPAMCMVGCTTCATLCLHDAIDFPSQGYVRQLIRDHRLLRRAKDKVREMRPAASASESESPG